MKTIESKRAAIPALGFGTWQLEGQECSDRVADALAAGYRHVDTAQRYGNHEAVGAGIRRSGVDRDEVFLASKVWFEDLHRDDVLSVAESSLKELRTDHLDLLMIHWPNPQIRLDETFDALLELRAQDRVRYIGVSNFPPSWVEASSELAPVVCNQVEYHPLLSQRRLLGTLRELDMALVAYSPLAHGEVLDDPTLREIAGDKGRSPAQVALRWLVQQDHVGAIPKAASRDHLEENLGIFDFSLDTDEMKRIHALARREGERVVDPDFAPRWER